MEFLQVQFDELNNFYSKTLPFLPEAISKIKKNNYSIQSSLEEFKTILVNLNNGLQTNKSFEKIENIDSILFALNGYAQNMSGDMQKEKNSLFGVNEFLLQSNNSIANQNEEIKRGNFELTVEERNYAIKNNIDENVLLKQKQEVIEKFRIESNSKNKNQLNNLEGVSSNIGDNNIELTKTKTINEQISELKKLITDDFSLSGNTFDMEVCEISLSKKLRELEEFGLSLEFDAKLLNEEYEKISENLRKLAKNIQLNIPTKLSEQQEEQEQSFC